MKGTAAAYGSMLLSPFSVSLLCFYQMTIKIIRIEKMMGNQKTIELIIRTPS